MSCGVLWVYVVFMACLMRGRRLAGLGLHGGLGMCACGCMVWLLSVSVSDTGDSSSVVEF